MNINPTTLQVFSEIVKLLGEGQDYIGNENLVQWTAPFRVDYDLEITYDLKFNRINLSYCQRNEYDSIVKRKYNLEDEIYQICIDYKIQTFFDKEEIVLDIEE